MDMDSRTTLATIANTVTTHDQKRVKPAECFMPKDQTISKIPAMNRYNQAMTARSFQEPGRPGRVTHCRGRSLPRGVDVGCRYSRFKAHAYGVLPWTRSRTP